jgi:hypothetical protein
MQLLKPGEGSDFASHRGIPTDPVSGTAVLEYSPTEILLPVAAVSKQPARLCRPVAKPAAHTRAESRGSPRSKADAGAKVKDRWERKSCAP